MQSTGGGAAAMFAAANANSIFDVEEVPTKYAVEGELVSNTWGAWYKAGPGGRHVDDSCGEI